MLRRDRQMRMQVHQLMDACLFALSFWLADVLRHSERLAHHLELAKLRPFEQQLHSLDQLAWFFLIPVFVGPLILEAQGFYERPIICNRWTTAWQLFKGCLITTLGLVLALFLAKMLVARLVVIWFGIISFVVVFAKEELLRHYFKSKLAQEQMTRRFVLVGNCDETARIRADVNGRPANGIEIVAELDLNDTSVGKLVETLHQRAVNGVILSAKHTYFEQVEAAIRACELEGVEAWLVADFFKTQISRPSFDDFYGQPVMVFRSTPEASWQSVSKEVIDKLGASLLLILVSPLLLIAALLIKCTSRGPVFFRQQRSGLNGRPFTIYKFRTMVSNAEQRKAELEAMNEMTGPVFKITDDPRVTPLGKLLRRSSIDEFPQFINVVRGEMSLVGPRPLPVDEVRRFNDLAHRRRLSVKPGLTCLWQISGRNNVKDFKDWVRLDLEYIDNWSLWLDMKILARTVPVVLGGIGAK